MRWSDFSRFDATVATVVVNCSSAHLEAGSRAAAHSVVHRLGHQSVADAPFSADPQSHHGPPEEEDAEVWGERYIGIGRGLRGGTP